MHFLESLTFVSKIQDAIIKEFRATLRMLLTKSGEARGKVVAGFRHRSPPGGNFLQIVFLANAQRDRSINAEQLLLQIAGFGIKRRTKIGRYLAQPAVCLLERRSRQLQNVRGIKTSAHRYRTVIRNSRMPQDLCPRGNSSFSVVDKNARLRRLLVESKRAGWHVLIVTR